jgi:hypothetical protein
VLTHPQPDETYIFTVTARNTDGQTSGSWRFKAPQPTETLPVEEPIPPGAAPEGVKDKESYAPPELPWANQSGKEGAERTVAEQRAKEHEEQQAKEVAAQRAAAVKHTEEQARQTEAEAQRAREAAAREAAEYPACLVPALKGDTLTAARRALTKAHCRLGAVHRVGRHHGTLRVSAQSAPAGERLAHNVRVALWLATKGSGAKRASRRERGTR